MSLRNVNQFTSKSVGTKSSSCEKKNNLPGQRSHIDIPCVHFVLSNILVLWILGHLVLLGINTESNYKIKFYFLALTQSIAKDNVNCRFSVPNARCTVHSAQYTVQSSQYRVRSAQFGVHSSQCTVNSSKCTVQNSKCIVQKSVHSAQFTVHSSQCTVHNTQYTVYSTQYTIHSIK